MLNAFEKQCFWHNHAPYSGSSLQKMISSSFPLQTVTTYEMFTFHILWCTPVLTSEYPKIQDPQLFDLSALYAPKILQIITYLKSFV